MRGLSLKWKIGIVVALLLVLAVAIPAVLLVGLKRSLTTYCIPSQAMFPTLQVNDRVLSNNLAYKSSAPQRGDIVVFIAPPQASPDRRERLFIKRVIAIPGDIVRITPGYLLAGEDQYGHQTIKQAISANPQTDYVRFTTDGVLLNAKPVATEQLAAKLKLAKGAKVSFHPGVVYLNGRPLDEPYTAEDSDLPYPMHHMNRECIIRQKTDEGYIESVKIPKGKLLVMGDNRNDSNDSRFWGLLDRERVTGKAVRIIFPENRVGPLE